MERVVLPRLVGARYVVPLREGGSLPAVIDTESTARLWSSSVARARAPKR